MSSHIIYIGMLFYIQHYGSTSGPYIYIYIYKYTYIYVYICMCIYIYIYLFRGAIAIVYTLYTLWIYERPILGKAQPVVPKDQDRQENQYLRAGMHIVVDADNRIDAACANKIEHRHPTE